MTKVVRYKNHKPFCICCICKAKRGEFKVSEKIKRQISLKMKGKPKSLATRKKMSIAQKGHQVSFSQRLNISNTLRGRKRPEVEKEKIRTTIKERIRMGEWEVPGLKLDSHWNWQGGKSKETYGIGFTKELKEEIRKRDDYTCQNCSMTEEEHLIVYGQVLIVHHIDYNKRNANKDNLISTCRPCNIRANYNRGYWKEFYQLKIGEKIKV